MKLAPGLKISRLVWGFWRLKQWNMSAKDLTAFVKQLLTAGIDTFDHADIYGDYSCEALFGQIIHQQPALRHKMKLVTKCGILLPSAKFPGRKINYYDTGQEHILQSVEQSLRNLHTDHIDLLLIHRPDPLMDPAETARAFEELHQSGKVLHFGVSNFTPADTEMLQSYLNIPLVTNQVEISPLQLEHFQNGNMAWFLKNRMHPMAWSPLGGGRLFLRQDKTAERVYEKLMEIGERKETRNIAAIALAWLLKHPAGIVPVLGSGKTERISEVLSAFEIPLTKEEWFEIYVAGTGQRMP